MKEIKTVVFDLGGVLVHLSPEVSYKAFKELGVTDIETMLNPYRQKGLFYELEMGLIDKVEFVHKLSQHAGRSFTIEQIEQAFYRFLEQVPLYKFEYLEKLRSHKQVFILSNTNQFVMEFAHSKQFLPNGRTLSSYVDRLYASNERHALKPDDEFFLKMIEDSQIDPAETLFIDDSIANIEAALSLGFQTLLAVNGEDWRGKLDEKLNMRPLSREL